MATKIKTRTRAEVYDLWVTALSSGEYEQGQSALNVNSKFCCLGVLCDLATKDGGPQWDHNDRASKFMNEPQTLPIVLRQFMELSDLDITLLITMNDTYELSFAEIAQFIRIHFISRRGNQRD